MHQEMHCRAQQENQIWQHTENMCAMFRPQEESSRREKYEKGEPIEENAGRMLSLCVHLWPAFRMMSAMVSFVFWRFRARLCFRVIHHIAHHSLQHGAFAFFHLLHVGSNLITESSKLFRISGR